MRDRRDPEEIKKDLLQTPNVAGVGRPKPGRPDAVNSVPASSTSTRTTPSSDDLATAELIEAAQTGLDSRAARFFSWLGNHFFGVTLVLTGVLLAWALTR